MRVCGSGRPTLGPKHRPRVESCHFTQRSFLGLTAHRTHTRAQYHWENDGYKTFDEFLAALKQSKRNSIRKVGVGVEFVCMCVCKGFLKLLSDALSV